MYHRNEARGKHKAEAVGIPRQLFKPATYRKIVSETAVQLGIRNTELAILGLLLGCLNYRTGQARMSRATMARKLGRHEDTIKKSISKLRKTGIIAPIAYARGGHARCPVYEFRYTAEAVRAHNLDATTGDKFTPVSVGNWIDNNRGQNAPQQGIIYPTTGGNSPPPSTESTIVNKKGKKDRPSRPENFQEAQPEEESRTETEHLPEQPADDEARVQCSAQKAEAILAEFGFPTVAYVPKTFGGSAADVD